MAINTTGYSAKQFLNLYGTEDSPEGKGSIARTVDDNPEFQFPGKTAKNIYDAPASTNSNPVIQRGFIRGIFPEIINSIQKIKKEPKYKTKLTTRYTGLETAPVRRCFFQFNPSLILRSVQASTTTLNPLLQDPTQLLQPIPGQASFEFQLLFNREYEVAAQKYVNADGTLTNTSPLAANLAAYGADKAAAPDSIQYNQDQLGDLGVLVDLYVLDSIIGQSITADAINSIQAYWETTKNLRPSDTVDDEGKPTQPYGSTEFLGKDKAKYKANLDKVLGNSAFLNPMPVRIVFSSLFMVEGFVTASNVAFHKFNRNMVPTVCQVTLSVQAMYIGFAKKESYVSVQLEEAIKQDITNDIETSRNILDCIALVKKEVFVSLDLFYSEMFYLYQDQQETYVHKDNESLNDFFKIRYAAMKKGTLQEANPKFLSFGTHWANAYGGDTSLKLWTGPSFKTDVGKQTAMEVNLQHLDIFFYKVSDTPSSIKTGNDIVDLAEKGNLIDGNYSDLHYTARSRVWWIDTKKGFGEAKRKLRPRGIPTEKIENAKDNNTSNHHWFGGDLEFDVKEAADHPNDFFGNSCYVVVMATISAKSKSGTGEPQENFVYKASVQTLNPNDAAGIKDLLQPFVLGART